jgi:TetR/AcrR family transcriptional regulator
MPSFINWIIKVTEQTAATGKTQRDGDTERRILDAARQVFMRRGTAGARMQEIAEEAGVNQALLHYYFRSKDGLAAAVFREAAGRLLPAIARLMGSDLPIEDKVEQFVNLYVEMVRQNPHIPGYVVSELHHHPERMPDLMAQAIGMSPRSFADLFLGKLRQQLEEGAARGTLRRIEPEQFLVNLFGLVMFPFIARPMLTAMLALDEAGFDRFIEQRRVELPRFILDSIRP